jgi:hypothetical protein
MSSKGIYSSPLRQQQTLRPTYLFIKQHTITGKLYFGKTYRTDTNVEKYLGSGTEWLKHLNEFGAEHVITLWYCLFYDKVDLKEFAVSFSIRENIVDSPIWANIVVENGLGGGSLKGRISPIRGKPSGRKGIKTGRAPINKGQPLSEEVIARRKATIKIRNAQEGYVDPNIGRRFEKCSCLYCRKEFSWPQLNKHVIAMHKGI